MPAVIIWNKLFFVCPKHSCHIITKGLEDKETPESPVEENAPDTKSLSSFQEYLPVQRMHISGFNKKAIHSIHKAEQLHLVYYEIIAPPPKT